MHGRATGQESRQQLYTMLTRGRAANHLYLQVVGDGDPYTVIRPEAVTPRTPTELLEQILARDDTPLQPRRSSADLASRRPGCTMRSSATPMACMPPLSKSSDPQLWTRSTAEPSKS
jgi:hypothetical protein